MNGMVATNPIIKNQFEISALRAGFHNLMIYPKYSVILLTKNAGGVFSEVLDRLFECEGINEGEVIMIDSGSTDLTLEYARKYSSIRLFKIHPADYGHGKTRNISAGLAKGDFIIYPRLRTII